ncbi:MAG: uroporphyrinogen decarboxylase family protein [Planctomycetota bacterium]|jgi:uroporphyrinogen decarboxylase
MELRDYILEQIDHRETRPVPFTLHVDPEVAERLDAHYGGPEWRERLTPYMHGSGIVDTDPREPAGEGRERDAYGGVWCVDRRPWHLEEPPLKRPTLDGYEFPAPERFVHFDRKDEAVASCEEHADRFRVAWMGWGLFELSWRLRGFENALVDAMVEEDFYEELLDRLTEIYLGFVEATADIPVDAIMFGDDWGDQRGVILGPERWRRFLKPRWARVYEATHASGKIAMSHCCGSVVDIMPDIIEIGLDVLESVQPEARGMSPYELKSKMGRQDHVLGRPREPEHRPLRDARRDRGRGEEALPRDGPRRRLHPRAREGPPARDPDRERRGVRRGVHEPGRLSDPGA